MKYWTTKTGEKLKIVDMETSHIENCIKMLEKNMESTEVDLSDIDDYGTYFLASLDIEEVKARYQKAIDTFKDELRYREMGKPIGEEPFSTSVIQRWEVNNFNQNDHEQ